MRVVVVGVGNQGRKRMAVAGDDVTATVDPVTSGAQYTAVEQVPLDSYDAALVCTSDGAKIDNLRYLLSHGKDVLVEKPLIAPDGERIAELGEIASSTGATCYTAYNHRFEPHVRRLKELLDDRGLGEVYTARIFYGNGTAMDTRRSPWRDDGLGVLSDLGSHLLDLSLFLFADTRREFEPWSLGRFENLSLDHVVFGSSGKPVLEFETTLLSWRNTFTIDVLGELGSAHVSGLCKWGESTLTLRKRVFPSGVPDEDVQTVEVSDPTWALDYGHFKELRGTGFTSIETDVWINSVLNKVGRSALVGASP